MKNEEDNSPQVKLFKSKETPEWKEVGVGILLPKYDNKTKQLRFVIEIEKKIENNSENSLENNLEKKIENELENNLENNLEKKIENNLENNSKNNLEKKIENNSENNSKNNSKNNLENNSENELENNSKNNLNNNSKNNLENNSNNSENKIIDLFINLENNYEIEQETIIIWKEKDETKFALSFDSIQNCREIFKLLYQFKNRNFSEDIDIDWDKMTFNPDYDTNLLDKIENDNINVDVDVDPKNSFIGMTMEIDDILPDLNEQTLLKVDSCLETQNFFIRKKICQEMITKNYLDKLFQLFENTEKEREKKKEKNIANRKNNIHSKPIIKNAHEQKIEDQQLQLLFRITKKIVSFNDLESLENIINEKNIMKTIGIFEYDPEMKRSRRNIEKWDINIEKAIKNLEKANINGEERNAQDLNINMNNRIDFEEKRYINPNSNPNITDQKNIQNSHRLFLNKICKFHEVIRMEEYLLDKIHYTYRLQYVRDVVLASILDPVSSQRITQIIMENYREIFNDLIEKNNLFELLNKEYNKEPKNQQTQKKVIQLLNEMSIIMHHIVYSSIMQISSFNRTQELLVLLVQALDNEDVGIQIMSLEIINRLVLHNTVHIRMFSVGEIQRNEKYSFFQALVKLIANQDDSNRTKFPAFDILMDLLNTTTINSQIDQENLLQVFYGNFMEDLVEQTLGLSSKICSEKKTLETSKAEIVVRVCEFLSFCIFHHGFRIKNFLIRSDIALKLLPFLLFGTSFLRVSIVKFFKNYLVIEDKIFIKNTIQIHFFKYLFEIFESIHMKNNLLVSSILELFSMIYQLNISDIVSHIATSFPSFFSKFSSSFPVFQKILNRFSENQLKQSQFENDIQDDNAVDFFDHENDLNWSKKETFLEKRRRIEEDERLEEDYFNDDDDDFENLNQNKNQNLNENQNLNQNLNQNENENVSLSRKHKID
ncbi:serine/threonine-protein phosphatase 4 regulatory subunit 3 [Anaeramoeba ignava]|uniref:Serine/threonine-protein phosphatase 4 regulatory subunit 3 n=1 Tax=Anaeramoeba ignava TaxID=1746090 RepID=A0A9Q0LKY6_ANAIG|nr:serine/threonine-protein phosphatase 4 regulatory subunit 3 [Anaeramoeba ignava]